MHQGVNKKQMWEEKGINNCDIQYCSTRKTSDPYDSTLKGRKAGVVGGLDLKVWGGIEGAQVVREDLDLLAGEPCGEATRAGSSSPALHWLITALSLLAPCTLSAGTAPKPHATRRKNTHISHVLHQPKHTNKHHTNAGTSSWLNSLTGTKTLDGMRIDELFSIKAAVFNGAGLQVMILDFPVELWEMVWRRSVSMGVVKLRRVCCAWTTARSEIVSPGSAPISCPHHLTSDVTELMIRLFKPLLSVQARSE